MTTPDYEELATGVEVMREGFRAMVAGLVSDGFSDEQARELIVSIFKRQGMEE